MKQEFTKGGEDNIETIIDTIRSFEITGNWINITTIYKHNNIHDNLSNERI